MTDSQNDAPSDGSYSKEEVQRLLEEAVQRSITVNVNHLQAPRRVANVYPGLGPGWHLFHAVMTFFFTCGFWAIVWIVHATVARRNWRSEQELLREEERQRREDQS